MGSRSVATIETQLDKNNHNHSSSNHKDSCGIWLWFCGEEEDDDATILQGSTVGGSTIEGTTVGTLDRDDDSISEFSLDFASIGFGPMSKLNEREKQFRNYYLESNSSEDDADASVTRSSTRRLHMHKVAPKQNQKQQQEASLEDSAVAEKDTKEIQPMDNSDANKGDANESRDAPTEKEEDIETNNYCNCFPSEPQAPTRKQTLDKVGEVVETKPIMEALTRSTKEMKRLHELEKRQRNAKHLVSTLLKEANAKLQADCEELEQRDPEEESDIDESSHGSIKLRMGEDEEEDEKEKKQEEASEPRMLDPPTPPMETPRSPQRSAVEEDNEVDTSVLKVASPAVAHLASTSTMQEPIDPTPRARYMKLSELRRAVHELSGGASGHGDQEGHYEYEPVHMLSLEDPVEPYLSQSRSEQVTNRGYYGMHGNPPPVEERVQGRYMPRMYRRQGEFHQPRRFQSSPEEWHGQARSPSPMRRNYEPVYYEQEFEQMGYAIPHWRGSMRPNQGQSIGPYGRPPPTHGYHYDMAGYGPPRMTASPPRVRRDYHGVGQPLHYRGPEFDEHSAYYARQAGAIDAYKRGYHRQYSSPSGPQRSMYAAPRDIDRIQEYSAQADEFHDYDMARSEQLPASVQLQMGARIARQESEKLALAARDFKRRTHKPERGIPAHS
eukprot:Nitzschia sp. Nitz4//scaffold14_size191712//183607//185607//NITZ4_001755-RA/size191712-processed-gene-0.293-mRNA-1//1//CDS//3329537023//959//frame0